MSPEETADALQARFGPGIPEVVHFRDEVTAVVERDRIVDVATFCRDDLGYDFLSDLSAVDWLDRTPRFDVVYHLNSMQHWNRFRLKVKVDEEQTVPSVYGVWRGCDWPEREVFDLFGIRFEGHPDMRRILMPEGWIGHPLRKDYPQTQINLPRPKSDKIEWKPEGPSR